MWKIVTKFSWILNSKRWKSAEILYTVDLVESFQTSIYYLLANIGVDAAENGPLKVRQKISQKLDKNLE